MLPDWLPKPACIISQRYQLLLVVVVSACVWRGGEVRWGGGLGAHKKSQGGGPEQHVEVLFRMFFSVAKQITARVATQKECQCTTSYSHPGVNGPQDGGPLRDTGAQVRRA